MMALTCYEKRKLNVDGILLKAQSFFLRMLDVAGSDCPI